MTVARGVKCHVTWRVVEMQRPAVVSNQMCSDCQKKTCDSRWLVFVFASGTVVAPVEF